MAELVESYLMTFMNFILLFLIAMVNTEDAQCMTNINIGISSAQLRYKFLSNKFSTLDKHFFENWNEKFSIAKQIANQATSSI